MTDSVSASIDGNEMDGEFSGHPKGLYVCLATELWERLFLPNEISAPIVSYEVPSVPRRNGARRFGRIREPRICVALHWRHCRRPVTWYAEISRV